MNPHRPARPPLDHPLVRPMDAAEARALLKDIGWTQVLAARYLGVAYRTMKRYLSSEAAATHEPIPASVAILLRLFHRYPVLAHDPGLGIVLDGVLGTFTPATPPRSRTGGG